jgi:hypothetical protein
MRPTDREQFLQRTRSDVTAVGVQVLRLYHLQDVFRRLVDVFESSPKLNQRWTPLHSFVFGGYTAQACLHIRRLMRDKGSHRQSVSLANLAERLAKHPGLITREDYVRRWSVAHVRLPDGTSSDIAALAQDAITEDLREMASREFDRFAHPGHDGISAERLRQRLAEVEGKCDRVLTYVDKRLAHYDRKKPDDPTWGDLDDAIDAVGEMFKHVSLLVTGSAPDCLVPEWQGEPWEDLLTVPWVTEKGEHDD